MIEMERFRTFRKEVELERAVDILVEEISRKLIVGGGKKPVCTNETKVYGKEKGRGPKTKKEVERDKVRRYRRAELPTDEDIEGMVYPAKDTFRRLAIGLTEEEGESGCVGNPNHNQEDGKFSSSRPRGSWSIGSKVCKEKGQFTRAAGTSSKGRDAEPCGRKSRVKGGSRRKCADPGEKVERSKNEALRNSNHGEKQVRKIKETGTALDTIESILRKVVRQELIRMRKQMAQQKQRCGFGAFLRQQDQLARAKSGELAGEKSAKA